MTDWLEHNIPPSNAWEGLALPLPSLTSHTLNSTAPDVLHHRHAEKGSGAYAILDLCRFQDSVVTNQKSVRLNHGARTQENVSVSYYFAYQMEVQGKAALRLGYDSLKAEQL